MNRLMQWIRIPGYVVAFLITLYPERGVADNAPISANTPLSSDSAVTQSSPLPSWIGVLAAVVGAMSILTLGLDAHITVAIQCLGGRSWGKYCVFNGPLELESRYKGMKTAFGGDQEVYIPKWLAGELALPPLSTADYDKLVAACDAKFRKRVGESMKVNNFLGIHIILPVWRWSFTKYGYTFTILWGTFALLPMSIVAIARW